MKMCQSDSQKQHGPVFLQRRKALSRWLQQPGLLLLLYSNYISVPGNGLEMF